MPRTRPSPRARLALILALLIALAWSLIVPGKPVLPAFGPVVRGW